MAFKDYIFFSYVFLATAVNLLAGPAYARLCDNARNKQVCEAIVHDRTDPRDGVVASMHKLVYETKAGKAVAKKFDKSLGIVQCIQEFDRAIEDAKGALKALSNNDLSSLKNFTNSAQHNFDICNKGFQGYGETNPIPKTTKLLDDIASVGLYLANLIKL
ncbi:uncharacterized protein LOC142616229 [Castanea sativa]|uniref:uncharacterized protein LOC142616229 n=1 Tax=Castanea sativa TaxID=21020 RepID=UPI003F64DED9